MERWTEGTKQESRETESVGVAVLLKQVLFGIKPISTVLRQSVFRFDVRLRLVYKVCVYEALTFLKSCQVRGAARYRFLFSHLCKCVSVFECIFFQYVNMASMFRLSWPCGGGLRGSDLSEGNKIFYLML